MNKLQPDTILMRANGIKLELDSANDIKIYVNGGFDNYHEHTLALLDVFSRPISLQSAITKIKLKGTQDWIDLTATITKLHKAGVLIEETQTQIALNKKPDGFDSAPIHISMLNDRERTESFLQAIKETVKAGDVVLDIGTGTGILAVAAAHAGASKIYAIEAGEIANVAQTVFENNCVAEIISIVRGWSTQIELPEHADVVISEVFGNDPFNEGVLQTLLDARKRFLKPNGRFVPSKVKVFGLPVNVPSEVLSINIITEQTLEIWRNWYGIDFTHLKQMNNVSTANYFHVTSQKAAGWQILGEPICFAEIDFQTFQDTTINKTVTAKAAKQGLLNGILIFFELELGSKTLTTNPRFASLSNHWLNPVWFFQDALKVDAYDEFEIQYSYNQSDNRNEVKLLEK